MRFIRGFGRNYFTLAAIQAYASAIRLMRIVHQVAWVNLISPLHVHSTLSPPQNVLNLSPAIFTIQGHLWLNALFHSSPPRLSSPR